MTADEARRFALDANVLVYAADSRAGVKSARAKEIIRLAARGGRCALSMQTIGEFFHAATRRGLVDRRAAAERAADYMTVFRIADPAANDARAALAEAAAGRFSYWDALLLATLGRAGCTLLLSEDMHDGASLAGVTVRNPFAGDGLPADVAAVLTPP